MNTETLQYHRVVVDLLEKIEENTRPRGVVDNKYDPLPTMTPHDNAINELCEVAQDLVDSFHYEGRKTSRFQDDMKLDVFQIKIWEQIKRLAQILGHMED
jgi:hypothetical protein